MTTRLADRMIQAAVAESTATIAQAANDPSLEWEEVSAIAGEQNVRLMHALEHVDGFAQDFIEASTDHALMAGIHMFEQASKTVDPEFIPDLVEGINVLVSRVRQSAEQGAPLPMSYMDPGVRKELFLVESFFRTGQAEKS